jgi:hypothetical protein
MFLIIKIKTFAVSITDPPPTAKKQSKSFVRAKSIASCIPKGNKGKNFLKLVLCCDGSHRTLS